MNRREKDLLPEYLLGHLTEEERRRVDDLSRASPDFAHDLGTLEEALAARAETLAPARLETSRRSRFLDALAGAERFAPFEMSLSQMVDLPRDGVRALFAHIDDAAGWERPLPHLSLFHFDAGPRLREVDAGFVRLARGARIPRHRHCGPETTLVLEGVLHEGGRRYFPGMILACPDGSIHDLAAGQERDLVFAVTHTGLEFISSRTSSKAT